MGWVSVGREESMSMKGSDRTRYQAQDLWLLRQTPYRLHYMALISAAQTAEGLVGFFFFLYYVHGKHLRSCRDGQLT